MGIVLKRTVAALRELQPGPVGRIFRRLDLQVEVLSAELHSKVLGCTILEFEGVSKLEIRLVGFPENIYEEIYA